MELPFLKNKSKNSGGGSVMGRAPDDKVRSMDDSGLMEQVCDELMTAIEKKDRAMLMEALRALVLYIQDEDQQQDEEMP